MARPYKVTLYYQNDEEILTSQVTYWNPAGGEIVDRPLMQNLAESVMTRAESQLTEFWAVNVLLYAVEVTTPAINGQGPARFIHCEPLEMGDSAGIGLVDSVVINVNLSGGEDQGKPVSGGFHVSGIPGTFVVCNVIDDTFIGDATSAWNDVFPFQFDVSNDTLLRVVMHKRSDGTVVPVSMPTIAASPRVGTRIDRVGNRPQKRSRPVVV